MRHKSSEGIERRICGFMLLSELEPKDDQLEGQWTEQGAAP